MKVFVAADNIISSLGFTTEENCSNIEKGISGIKEIDDPLLAPYRFYASLVDSIRLQEYSVNEHSGNSTRFERLAIHSASEALSRAQINTKSKETLFILSTTKGNVDLINSNSKKNDPAHSLFLWDTAKKISAYFENPNTPYVISNACISGVAALIIAARMIRAGQYQNIIVIGCDIISEFVVSGFQSFQSLSNGPCKPYDKARDGLSLGEGCGTIILTSNAELISQDKILVGGGSISNDANHISGPSRTGEGLFIAMKKAMEDPHSSTVKKLDYISAHGTATPYNDEMEAIALSRLGLLDVPVNSLKGYWGHTLGAAGVIESAVAINCMKKNILFKTAGCNEIGVTEKINVIAENIITEVNACMKTASGFGGCNAAIIFYKE